MPTTFGPPETRFSKPVAGQLRARLLALRLRAYHATLPEPPVLAEGRLDELISSLHAVLLLLDPSRDIEFRQAVGEQCGRHMADEATSFEAVVAEALGVVVPEDNRITVAELVEVMGEDPDGEGNKPLTTKVGLLLRSSVGLVPTANRVFRGGKKRSAYIWDAKRVERFIERYNPENGCQVVQKGVSSPVDESDNLPDNLCFGGCPGDEIVHSERTTSEDRQPTDSEVVKENTLLEHGNCAKRTTCQPGQSTLHPNVMIEQVRATFLEAELSQPEPMVLRDVPGLRIECRECGSLVATTEKRADAILWRTDWLSNHQPKRLFVISGGKCVWVDSDTFFEYLKQCEGGLAFSLGSRFWKACEAGVIL